MFYPAADVFELDGALYLLGFYSVIISVAGSGSLNIFLDRRSREVRSLTKRSSVISLAEQSQGSESKIKSKVADLFKVDR